MKKLLLSLAGLLMTYQISATTFLDADQRYKAQAEKLCAEKGIFKDTYTFNSARVILPLNEEIDLSKNEPAVFIACLHLQATGKLEFEQEPNGRLVLEQLLSPLQFFFDPNRFLFIIVIPATEIDTSIKEIVYKDTNSDGGDVPVIRVKNSNNKPYLSNPSGYWFDPEYTGMGFSFSQVSNGTYFAYFGYDQEGTPLWLMSDVYPESPTLNQPFKVDMYAPAKGNGANFNTAPHPVNGNDAGVFKWGKAEVTFNDCHKAVIKLTGENNEIQTFNISRLAYPNDIFCRVRKK